MFLLQAEQHDFDAINLSTDAGPTGWIFMGSVLLVFVILGWIYVKRSRINNWKYQGVAVGVEEIFKRLCEANSLTTRETFLMRKLVYDMRLQNPLLAFVDLQLFDSYANALGGNRRAQIIAIREKVFS